LLDLFFERHHQKKKTNMGGMCSTSSGPTAADIAAAKVKNQKVVAAKKAEYSAHMNQINATVAPGSWSPDDFPPSEYIDAVPFGGGEDADAALALAATFGFLNPILLARNAVAVSLYALQLLVCMACGDSRTAKEDSGLLPTGQQCRYGWYGESWDPWAQAHHPSKPGYDLNKLVLAGIDTLKDSKGVNDLANEVGQLAEAVYSAIPGEVVAVDEFNTKPTQGLGLESTGALGGKMNDADIPMDDWTSDMRVQIEAAIVKLEAGEFGDPGRDGVEFYENGRIDLFMIRRAIEQKMIVPAEYLIVLGINRSKTFHAKGLRVALLAAAAIFATTTTDGDGDGDGDGSAAAAADADAASEDAKKFYSAGPLKNDARVSAKCLPGADYYSLDVADSPNCKWVLDMLRATIKCINHAMMHHAYLFACEIFGAPLVIKDRRQKPQHDMLLVFMHEGLLVEVQLHFVNMLTVKVLAHAVFEIQRLSTDVCVTASGLNTVIRFPPSFMNSATNKAQTAKDVKLLLHI